MKKASPLRRNSVCYTVNGVELDPIMSLLMFRADPSTLPPEARAIAADKDFKSLPSVKKRDITKLMKQLSENNDFSECLQKAGITRPFSGEMTRELISQLSKNPMQQHLLALRFLFICLYFLATDSNSWKVDDLRLLIDGLSLLVPTVFLLPARTLFLILAVRLLNFPNYELAMQDFVTMHKFYMMDKDMPASSFPILNQILVTGLRMGNDALIGKQNVVFLAGLLEENRVVLSAKCWDSILEASDHLITVFDPSAISIIFKMASVYSSDLMVRFFRRFPAVFYQKIVSGKVLTDVAALTVPAGSHTEEEWRQIKEKDGETGLPPQAMLSGVVTAKSFIPSSVLFVATTIPVLVKNVAKDNMEAFQRTVCELIPSIEGSEYFVDLVMFFASFLPYFDREHVLEMLRLLSKSPVFSPMATIFCENGLSDFQNGLRNFLFRIIAKTDVEFFADLLQQCESPLLFAEHLARVMTEVPEIEAEFFMCEKMIRCLGSNMVKLKRNKDQESTIQESIARNVIYSYIFSLLNNPSTALLCFSSEVFSSTFTLLVFDNLVREAVFGCIRRTITALNYLPQALQTFLMSCYTFAVENYTDEDAYKLVHMMTSTVIDGVLHNPKLVKSSLVILPHLMKFAALTSSSTALDAILTIYTMCVRDRLLSVSERFLYFREVITLINKLENEEQQGMVYKKLMNCLGDSTALQVNQMFSIRVGEIIPVIVFSTVGTKLFLQLLESFTDLCHFSEKNAIGCIDAGLPQFLTGSLLGKIEYLNVVREVRLSSQEKTAALRLLVVLLNAGTSSTAEDGIFELVRPTDQHVYSDCALDVLNAVCEIVDAADRNMYPIFSHTPIMAIEDFDYPNLNISFCLAFWVKIDSGYIGNCDRSYILFEFEDESGARVQFCYTGGTIVMSVIITEDISESRCIFELSPETRWHYVTFALNKQFMSMELYRHLNFSPLQNTTFPSFHLGTKVKFRVGYVSDPLAADEYCPVALGDFALIDLPYSDVQVAALGHTGLDALTDFKNVRITSMTQRVTDTRSGIVDRTFTNGICERLDAGKWLRLFWAVEHAPKYYLERLFELCLKLHDRFSTRLCISFEDRMVDWKETLAKLSGVDIEKIHSWNFMIDFSGEKSTSMIGAIVGYVARQNSLSLSLYKVIWSQADAFPEIYPNVLFNLFLWNSVDAGSLRKIFGFWVAEVASIIRDHRISLFKSLLVQMHVLSSYSSRNVEEIRNWRMRILEQVLISDFKPEYYELVVSCLGISEKSEEVAFYVDLLNVMPQRDALDPQSIYINLVSIITKAGPQVIPVLYTTLLPSSTCDIALMENQLGLPFVLLDSSLPIPETLIFKCIQVVSQGDIDDDVLPELENYSVSMGAMWPLWPVITAILHPKAAPIIVEKIIGAIFGSVRFMLWYETVLNILDVCDSKNLGSSSIFRRLFVSGLCKKLVENQELADTIELEKFIIRSAFSMLFTFSSKFQTQRLLDLFKESMFDVPDESGGDDEDDLPPLKRVLKLFSTRKECRFLFEVRSDADPEVIFRDLIELKTKCNVSFITKVGQIIASFLDQSQGHVALAKDKTFSVLMEDLAPSVQNVASETALEIEQFLASPVQADPTVYWKNIEKIIRKECFKFFVILATNVQKPYHKSVSVERFIRFPITNPSRRMRLSGRCSDVSRTSWEARIFVHNELTFSLIEFEALSCVFRTGDLKKFFKMSYEEIECVIAPNGLDFFDIFSKHCDSIRVKTSKEKVNEICNKFDDSGVSVISNIENHISECIQMWANNLMSNLALVFSLNFLNGRSFNSKKPLVFPGDFWDLRRITDSSLEEQLECYHKCAQFEDGVLDREWFKTNFHVELPERQLSGPVSPAVSKISLQKKIKKVYFIPRMFCFYCELSDDSFQFVRYKVNKGEKLFTEVESFPHGSRLIAMPMPDGLRFYDMDSAMLHKLVGDRVLSRPAARGRLGPCCVAGNTVFFVLDRNAVATSPVVGFPIERRVIVYEKESVTMMACNPKLDIIAYLLDSGVIKVVACPSGVVVGSFSVTEFDVKRILVSNNWCFVCIESEKELIVFKRHGEVISRTPKTCDIKLWATFSTNMAEDYLLIFDVYGNARIAELANVGEIRVLAETRENILNVQITQNPLTVTAVSEEGSVFTIPICL